MKSELCPTLVPCWSLHFSRLSFCPDMRLCFLAGKFHPKLLRGWLRDTGYPICYDSRLLWLFTLLALSVLFAIRYSRLFAIRFSWLYAIWVLQTPEIFVNELIFNFVSKLAPHRGKIILLSSPGAYYSLLKLLAFKVMIVKLPRGWRKMGLRLSSSIMLHKIQFAVSDFGGFFSTPTCQKKF